MNLLNLAASGLAGAVFNSPPPLAGSPVASAVSKLAGSTSAVPGPTSNVPGRDSVIADLPNILSSVNLLQQAASLQTAAAASSTATSQPAANASDEPDLSIPALTPMPAPKAAPDMPTDDHGQSNIVFSDSSADGALIH